MKRLSTSPNSSPSSEGVYTPPLLLTFEPLRVKEVNRSRPKLWQLLPNEGAFMNMHLSYTEEWSVFRGECLFLPVPPLARHRAAFRLLLLPSLFDIFRGNHQVGDFKFSPAPWFFFSSLIEPHPKPGALAPCYSL